MVHDGRIVGGEEIESNEPHRPLTDAGHTGAVTVTRSQLYARVWETPIVRLAAEFNLSDNGLRKICKKHDIPLPPRGYWARLAAGQQVEPAKLPRRSDDSLVDLPTAPEGAAPNTAATPLDGHASEGPTEVPLYPAEIRPALVGCHEIVRRTERFFSGVAAKVAAYEKRKASPPKTGGPRLDLIPSHRNHRGRLFPTQPGCLRIVATLKSIDWILRFHDALIRCLALHGCTADTRTESTFDALLIRFQHDSLVVTFSEDFETRKLRDPARPWVDTEYLAKDRYRLKILGRGHCPEKNWGGSQDQLSERLPSIAREMAQMLQVLAADREVREAAAEERRVTFANWLAEQTVLEAARKAAADRKAARAAQLDRLHALLANREKHASALRLLAELEGRGDHPALRAWIDTVRAGLVDPTEAFLREIEAEGGGDHKPLWWPGGATPSDRTDVSPGS